MLDIIFDYAIIAALIAAFSVTLGVFVSDMIRWIKSRQKK